MPTPFNRLPFGLLGALDAKVGGRNPQTLADDIQAGMEVFGFYYCGMREVLTGQGPTIATSVGNANFNILGELANAVPNGELWWVEAFHVEFNTVLGAGAACLVSPAHLIAPTSALGGPLVVTYGTRFNQATTGGVPCGDIDRGFWALPGDRLLYKIESQVGGTIGAFNGVAQIARFRV